MCAIFGLIDYRNYFTKHQREKVLKVLSKECEVRGTDATGFAYIHDGRLSIFKRPLAAHKMRLRLPFESNIIMGHTRMATQGNKFENYNNHPFSGMCGSMKFALAHNGVLHNDEKLRRELKLPATKIATDSYIAVQLLEQKDTLDFDSIAQMAEQLEGSFTITVLDVTGNLYFVKGDNPLALYHFEREGFYIYASTAAILDCALITLGLVMKFYTEIDAKCGDILRISPDGELTSAKFNTAKLDALDYYYSYRPYWWTHAEPEDYAEWFESAAVKELKQFASYIGVSENDIDLLLEYGYTVDDVEDLLYIPEGVETAVEEILCEYAYCGGEW